EGPRHLVRKHEEEQRRPDGLGPVGARLGAGGQAETLGQAVEAFGEGAVPADALAKIPVPMVQPGQFGVDARDEMAWRPGLALVLARNRRMRSQVASGQRL